MCCPMEQSDIPGVLAILEQGLQSPEFAAFLARYQTR